MKKAGLIRICADRLLPVSAAVLLLVSIGEPLFELKGFDEFGLESVSEWTGVIARWVVVAGLVSCFTPFRALGRWFLALGVGLLASPLIGLVSEAMSLAEVMSPGETLRPLEVIEPLAGLRLMVAGGLVWLLDALIWAISGLIMWRRRTK